MEESLKSSYFEFIKPLKIKIDEVVYKNIL